MIEKLTEPLAETIHIANQGTASLFQYGLAITVLILMLGASMAANVFFFRCVLGMKDVLAELVKSLAVLNERIKSHD